MIWGEHLSADRVAIHLEVGPGDTVRLVHALQRLHGTASTAVLTTTAGLRRAMGLYARTESEPNPVMEHGCLVYRDGPVSWIANPTTDSLQCSGIATWLRGMPLEWGNIKQPIAHVYLPDRDDVKPGDKWSTVIGCAEVPFERIDRQRLMTSSLLHIGTGSEPRERSNSLRLACFVRKHHRYPFKNTPSWFVSNLLEVAKATRVSLRFFGFETLEGFNQFASELSVLDCAPYGNQTFLQQLHALHECDGAIGFESGGLYLAAAVPLPVLRIAEFQRKGVWGARYNTFVANYLNVGLRPERDDNTESFPVPAFKQAVGAFLEILANEPSFARTAGHYQVPFGAALTMKLLRELPNLVNPIGS